MEKILENTYRNINIGLINELAMLCDKMGNIWEVIEAAKTNLTGFRSLSGRGLGGHCIPLILLFVLESEEYGLHLMIEASMMINDRMPECVERAAYSEQSEQPPARKC